MHQKSSPRIFSALSPIARAAPPEKFRAIGVDTETGERLREYDKTFNTLGEAQEYARRHSSSGVQVSVYDDQGNPHDRAIEQPRI